MKSFDEIIKSKLDQIQVDSASSTWSSVEQGIAGINSNTAFKAPFIAGIASSIVIGSALVALPPIGSEDIVPMMEETELITNDHELNKAATSLAFEEVEIQVDHTIELEKKSAVVIADEPTVQKTEVDIASSTPAKQNSLTSETTSTVASHAVIDFDAKGIQCANSGIRFNAITSNQAKITWLFDGLTVLEGKSVSHQFDEAGQHSIRMVATFDDDSQQAISSDILIHEQPNASFLDEIDSKAHCLNSAINLQAIEDNLAYKWVLNGDTVNEGKSTSISIGNGLHTIVLQTVNEAGCTSIEKRAVSVNNSFRLNIPNAFSASNADGLNDSWTIPELAFAQKFDLKIVRLSTGNTVFESTQDYEWDGSISGSSEMPIQDEIFSFKLTVVDECGEVTHRSGTIRYL